MSSISSVNCDFLLVWRLFRNLMNTRLRNLTITSQAFGFGVKYPEPTILDRFYEKGARVLKAVVFDMDETLLSINLNAFILRYFKDVSSMLADIGRAAAVARWHASAPSWSTSTPIAAAARTIAPILSLPDRGRAQMWYLPLRPHDLRGIYLLRSRSSSPQE